MTKTVNRQVRMKYTPTQIKKLTKADLGRQVSKLQKDMQIDEAHINKLEAELKVANELLVAQVHKNDVKTNEIKGLSEENTKMQNAYNKSLEDNQRLCAELKANDGLTNAKYVINQLEAIHRNVLPISEQMQLGPRSCSDEAAALKFTLETVIHLRAMLGGEPKEMSVTEEADWRTKMCALLNIPVDASRDDIVWSIRLLRDTKQQYGEIISCRDVAEHAKNKPITHAWVLTVQRGNPAYTEVVGVCLTAEEANTWVNKNLGQRGSHAMRIDDVTEDGHLQKKEAPDVGKSDVEKWREKNLPPDYVGLIPAPKDELVCSLDVTADELKHVQDSRKSNVVPRNFRFMRAVLQEAPGCNVQAGSHINAEGLNTAVWRDALIDIRRSIYIHRTKLADGEFVDIRRAFTNLVGQVNKAIGVDTSSMSLRERLDAIGAVINGHANFNDQLDATATLRIKELTTIPSKR